MTHQRPRVSTSRTTLHLAPGTYKVADLMAALEAVRTAGQGEVDVTTYPRLPEPVVQVQVHNGLKFNQESLDLFFNTSPAPKDKLGLANWLDALPVGSVVRNNNTRRQLRKVDTLQWSTAGGYLRNSWDLTINDHSYTLVKRGKVNG